MWVHVNQTVQVLCSCGREEYRNMLGSTKYWYLLHRWMIPSPASAECAGTQNMGKNVRETKKKIMKNINNSKILQI